MAVEFTGADDYGGYFGGGVVGHEIWEDPFVVGGVFFVFGEDVPGGTDLLSLTKLILRQLVWQLLSQEHITDLRVTLHLKPDQVTFALLSQHHTNSCSYHRTSLVAENSDLLCVNPE